MKEQDDKKNKSHSLADMLAAGDDKQLWKSDELTAILEHQLAAPIDFDLSRFDPAPSHSMLLLTSPDGPPIRTFDELFRHPHPPVEILELTKRFAKECRSRRDGPVPDEIATILYTLSIVTALTKCGRRITKADNQTLRHSLDWALSQPWVDKSTRGLLREGYAAMSTLDKGAMSEKTPAMSTAEMPALERLGEYELLEELGRGGMGTVYKARHTQLDRIVALKVLAEAHTANQQAVARFRREMKAVGRLDHPNIVRAHDARQIGDRHFLVMEYVDGWNLDRLSGCLGPLPAADACELVRQAAVGLAYAHRHKLVHRDIKPSNLMLTTDGQLKILDLGLARIRSDQSASVSMTAVGQAMGTPDYMAPEQLSDSHSVDIRADIYSLGCTLYKLLTGAAPFERQECADPMSRAAAHLHDTIPPIRHFRDDLPNGLAAVVNRMLAKSPDERFAEPAEVAAAMEPFARGCDLRALPAMAKGERTPPAGASKTRAPADKVAAAAAAKGMPYRVKPRMPTAKRVRPLPWWQRPWAMIAAAVLLVGALGTVFLLTRDNADKGTTTVDRNDRKDDGLSQDDTGGNQAAAVVGRRGVNDWIVISWGGQTVGRANLWLCRPDGRTKIPITDDPDSFNIHPKFSPDGRRIAFVHGKPPEPTGVWVCNADGSNPRALATGRQETERLLSPVWISNSRIYYTRDPKADRSADMEVWQVDLDGGEPQLVFRFNEALGEDGGLVTDVSPDRQQLAVAALRAGEYSSCDVYITDLRGQLVDKLWTDSGDDRKDSRALWSPTGKTIAWQHTFSEVDIPSPGMGRGLLDRPRSMGGKRPPGGRGLAPPHDGDRFGPKPPMHVSPSPDSIKFGIGLSRLGEDGRWHPELQPDGETQIIPLAWSPEGNFLLCARLEGTPSHKLKAMLFLMDDRFREVRFLFPLDGSCWRPGQPDFGRLADWAFVPEDLTPPDRK